MQDSEKQILGFHLIVILLHACKKKKKQKCNLRIFHRITMRLIPKDAANTPDNKNNLGKVSVSNY